jgi:hypothetical protein
MGRPLWVLVRVLVGLRLVGCENGTDMMVSFLKI